MSNATTESRIVPVHTRDPYTALRTAAERVNWRLEEVIGGDLHLDFGKRFLPESLARVEPLTFLSPDHRRVLNQIRGHAYLYMFGLVEEFILPFVLDQARPRLHGDGAEVRALLGFASDEAKHIELFRRFRREFEAGFGTPCAVIGPPEAIARMVLAHHPLSVALITLHIEWFSQSHYVDSVKDDHDLDPQFKSLLRHHWLEEAQHAQLDELMVLELAKRCTPQEIDKAIDGYLAIGGIFDAGLAQQVELDRESLEVATGHHLTAALRERFTEVQRQANRWTYIGSGMKHPRFLAMVETIAPGARARIEAVATTFA